MGKAVVIVVLLAAELAIMTAYMAVLLMDEYDEQNLANARSKTAVITITCAALIFTNVIVCCVVPCLTDGWRWYDFGLVLIALFETLAGLLSTLFSIPMLWFRVTWHKFEALHSFYRVSNLIAAFTISSNVFAYYSPAIILSLQVYRYASSARGELSTRAMLTPVVVTTVLAFATSLILTNSNMVNEDGGKWIHTFHFVMSYALPAVVAIVLIVALHLLLRRPYEDSVEAGRVFKIFTVLSVSFIVLCGPKNIGRMVYFHGDQEDLVGSDYSTFHVVSVALVLMKSLLNLPILLIIDHHFYRGFMKLLGKCFPRTGGSSRLNGEGSTTVRYKVDGDAEALLEKSPDTVTK